MTSKLFFTGGGKGEHPGPTYFGTLPQSIWGTNSVAHNLHLESLLASLFGLQLLKSILATLTRTFIEKGCSGEDLLVIL